MRGPQLATMLLVLTALSATTARGEPTSAVRYLTNERASMLDIGVMRLESQLAGCFAAIEPEGFMPPRVSYDWQSNRFQIRVLAVGDSETVAQVKSRAQRAVDQVRVCLGIDVRTGLPPEGSTSFVDLFFCHHGYTVDGWPTDLGSELDSITEIRVEVYQTGGPIRLACEIPLVGGELLCSD